MSTDVEPTNGAAAEARSVTLSRQLGALYQAWRAGAIDDAQWQSAGMALRDQLYAAARDEAELLAVSTPVVVAGELIESAWGNTVRADLLAHDTAIGTKVIRAGDTMTGALFIGGDHATTAGSILNTNGVIYAGTNSANPVFRARLNWTAPVDTRYMDFQYNGVLSGAIVAKTSGTVAYNTTSDRRLKQPTGSADDAADIIQQLGRLAYRGRWIGDDDGDEWVFINSQDVEPLAPFAVSGDPDGVATDADVDAGYAAEVGGIIPQQLDSGSLVPLLIAALSQALDRITALETA